MFIAFKMRTGKEEDFLSTEFGEEYSRYTREVAQLIPYIRI
jgi:protein-S-isoprenylcysteine O-methyltransferase Ste14